MNRSLDSVLDSVLASINLDNSSSSDEVLVTPVNTRGILFADQVELSHRPLLSAEVTNRPFYFRAPQTYYRPKTHS